MDKEENDYKKILIVTAGRINFSDTANNGLLFRSLFNTWPKNSISQIYNSGSNDDKGVWGSYYKLNSSDRRLGKLYSRLHKENSIKTSTYTSNKCSKKKTFLEKIIFTFKRILIETGIYELIFYPKLSLELINWLDEINPDIILAQGYSITFTKLPLLIKKYTGAKLAFFTTDDWPKYLYAGNNGEIKALSIIPNLYTKKLFKQFIREIDIPIAFGFPMQKEYTIRYGKKFNSIIHADNSLRFKNAVTERLVDNNTFSIVTIGSFDKFRVPIIADLNRCCENLKLKGLNSQIQVISDAIEPESYFVLKDMDHVNIHRDPGSDNLVPLLKGADLLVLIETFDNNRAEAIKLSISTKAHLYMFSKVPILLLSHPITGISNYAREYNWAYVVNSRNEQDITNALELLLTNNKLRSDLIENAYNVAMKNHNINITEEKLRSILQ